MGEVSSIKDFKRRTQAIVTLPSGFKVKLRNPGGMQAFFSTGLIPNSLMNIVNQGIKTGDVSMKDLSPDGNVDDKMISDMSRLMDDIALRCMVEPKLNPVPNEKDLAAWNKANKDNKLTDVEDLRSDDKLYVDEIDEEDKLFIFHWMSSGVTDLETFRNRQKQGVDTLSAGEGDTPSA